MRNLENISDREISDLMILLKRLYDFSNSDTRLLKYLPIKHNKQILEMQKNLFNVHQTRLKKGLTN